MATGESKTDRGAALILTLFFLIIGLPLTLTLLAFSDQVQRAEGQVHDTRVAHAVLRVGVHTALNEINQDTESTTVFDPDGDGVGALGTGLGDGTVPDGVAVRDDSGRVLGRYRATLEVDGTTGQRILTVVAATPAFGAVEDGVDIGYVVAAKMEVAALLPLSLLNDANALSILGDVDAGVTPNLTLNGNTTIQEPSPYQRPAINVTDSSFYSSFESEILSSTTTSVVGGHETSDGYATGTNAISNNTPGIITSSGLQSLASSIDAYVAGAGGTDMSGTDITGTVSSPTEWDSGGVYRISSTTGLHLEEGEALTGSGTLIIDAGKIEIEDGAELSWNGDIIVTGSGTIEVLDGGSLNVSGNLISQQYGSGNTANLELQAGSSVSVDGNLTMLGDSDKLELKSTSTLTVTGIMSMLGDGISYESHADSTLNVLGSMVVAAPDDATTGINELIFNSGATTNLTFDETQFNQALAEMRESFDEWDVPESLMSQWYMKSYHEPSGWGTMEEQRADIEEAAEAFETLGL